jgi:tryptophan synthase alpha chain
MSALSGVERIGAVFDQAGDEGRAALMPYLVLGHPTPEASLELIEAAITAGADLLELGVSFSDPLADGPTIQQATQVALQQGMSMSRCLEMVSTLRARGLETPFMLMGYYNPILAYGVSEFCHACQVAGVDGLIVPDLPPEEGDELEEACRRNGRALVYLLAPTSPSERIRLVTKRSQGFVYLVSLTGITGARDQLPSDLAAFVQRVRSETKKPLAVGFGISTAEQARQVASLADGIIVGSALVRRAAERSGVEKVPSFISELHQATFRH